MIKVSNLSKKFDDNIVFERLNLEFAQNQINAIMAPSGQGKTTLINILLGFLKQDCGEIVGFDCKPSVVFQEDRLIEDISSLKNVEIAVGKDKLSKARELFDKFNVDFSKKVSTLSGGMKRRTAIIRALLFDADIYIFDEPFKGIDEQNKKIVMNEIKKLGKTVIIITHNLDEVTYFDIKLHSSSNGFELYR